MVITAFVHAWVHAVASTGYVTLDRAELERLFLGYARTLDDALRSEPFCAQPAAEIGEQLVALRLGTPEALRRTVELIGRELSALSGGMNQDRIAALQGALAVGFTRRLRERIQTEQESLLRAVLLARQSTEEELRDDQARFHAVFTQARMGIAIIDLTGLVLDANNALLTMLGYQHEQLCGMDVTDLFHSEDRGRVRGVAARKLLSGRHDDHFRLERRLVRADGEVLLVQLSATLVREDTDAPRFWVAMTENLTDRYRLQHRLRHQALHDPLTQLPNRALFLDRLTEIFRDGMGRVGVCYLDLDGFKMINDSLGHDIGDQLLVVMARRLDSCARGGNRLPARLGGDEFAVLVQDCAGTQEAVALAETLLRTLSAPVRIAGHELVVTPSIGVVERAVASCSPAEIMQDADITLYWAKGAGKGRWALYDAERNAGEVTRYRLAATMPAALDREEFYVDYQPLVHLADETVVGAEALLRWRHPELGKLGPDRFIGLAEETGLIVTLGEWVLRRACWQATRWDRGFVSVNLAERQVRDPRVVDTVAAILNETGLAPERLQLELTETAAMGTDGEALRTLRRLANLGVRIAIDDFGTGYSNLAYLRRLPVHELKIAGAFMDGLRSPLGDPVDQRIVETLVSLAHTLGLTVTAEKVETEAQAIRLRDIGCDSAQGWYFAPAGPPEFILGLLGKRFPQPTG